MAVDLTEVALAAEISAEVAQMAKRLDARAAVYERLEQYIDGNAPEPWAIRQAKLTRAYRMLMPLAEAPWGDLVVGSVTDRLEVSGIQSPDKAADKAVWESWQENHMDADSKLGHDAGLLTGRAFALVWPDAENDDRPEITLDNSAQMIVKYREGSYRKRAAALRMWKDEESDVKMATLYRPDGIYKFQFATDSERANSRFGDWIERQEGDEPWPVPNPFELVPVVEVPFNRRLASGQWGGKCRGEFEHCVGLIDRINLLTFLGLVVAFWMGFPLRGVTGERILRDDDNKPLAPFDADPGGIFTLENPNAQIVEYKAADRSNLALYPELGQLAAITRTPRHYFPLEQAMSNLSADAIRADEGALNAKVGDHKGTAGEGWEEVQRVAGAMLPEAVELPQNASLVWADRESRSIAERADAANKLSTILPWQALAATVLGATQDQIARWQTMRTSDSFSALLSAAAQGGGQATVTVPHPGAPAAAPEQVPAASNGAAGG